jgi:hypothetical protein
MFGANAYEVWREWIENTHLYGGAPTLNNVGARLGELVRVQRKNGTWRECKYPVDGHPPLFRTRKVAPTGTGAPGLIYVPWRYRRYTRAGVRC